MSDGRVSWFAVAGGGIAALIVVVASVCVAGTPGAVLHGRLVDPITPETGGEVAFTVEEGASAGRIGNELEKLGIIRSGLQFQVLVSLMGLQNQLSAGDYILQRGTPILTVIDSVTVKASGPVLRVTFPEGIRVEEMATIAAKAGFGTAQEFLDAVAAAQLPAEFAASLPPGQGLQGYLFPDTYFLPVGATAADLVHEMLKTFETRFSPELRAAAKARGLTLHQALTLASIVEREAAISEERPLIAGVFYNRLAAGDIIGADPTVQFALALDPKSVEEFGWWKKELTLEDLKNPSPYNTRLNGGIPPGPITNPGLASIEAVANPAQTDYYYFVADAKKGDGSHRFAVTDADHQRNIALYGSP
ncbi:MAG: endolytic transglycosylase MltG [Chloroflexi bacterium]|nr:endolytic transglycosylase MltG [Chloroflexota bacterium]